ncbi:MAG: S8 family peptidase [Gammaproteobacteria bacterium]|nr:S8 family peptidase [Gammaproteobacteria bacterium]
MSRRLTTVACVLLAAAAGAASPVQPGAASQVTVAEGGGGAVAVLPARTMPQTALNGIEGLAVEVLAEGGNLVYQAEYQGRIHKAYVRLDGRPKRLAFNPRRHRFEEVTSNLLVGLAAHQALDAVVDAAGALDAKAYPALGFALLRLPKDANPAQVARNLRLRGLADRARLLTASDRRVPASVPYRKAEVAHLLPAGVAKPRAAQGAPRFGAAAKDHVAPDLLAFFGAPAMGAGVLGIEASVLNWGGRRSTPTALVVAINDMPNWSDANLWIGEGEVPDIDPQSGFAYEFSVDLADFPPGRDYYAIAYVEEIASEHAGRTSNYDFMGFSLDESGAVVVRCQRPASGRPNAGAADPLAREQWHLANSGQRAFAAQSGVAGEDLSMTRTLQERVSGRGVRVAVVDTGLEVCHPDLAANVEAGESHNFNARDWAGALSWDPFLPSTMGDHGTSVAGVVAAAADNGVGGRGVAPGASLRGYNYLSAIDSAAARLDSLGASMVSPNSAEVDIFNLSFGSLGHEGNPDPDQDVALLRHGVTNLRDGRGALYVKAAGNAFGACSSIPRALNELIGCASSNADPTNNLPYVIVVGGHNASGQRASYSSVGANLWISAPSGEFGGDFPAIITTDQAGLFRGYDNLATRGLALDVQANPHGHYISTFNGTSSAAPNASGAIALLLEAHPALTWRDVKHLLAKSARWIDPHRSAVRYGLGGAAQLLQRPWDDASPDERARNWYGFGAAPYVLQLPWITNAAGYRFHNWYGFGALAIDEALDHAASHEPGSLGAYVETGSYAIADRTAIPDHSSAGLVQSLDISGLPADANIEAVTLSIDVTHPFTNDLGIHLISPSGTESILNPVFNDVLANNQDLDWQLLSNAFYGERPNGTWTLTVVDAAPEDAGWLNGWSLRFALGTHLP